MSILLGKSVFEQYGRVAKAMQVTTVDFLLLLLPARSEPTIRAGIGWMKPCSKVEL